MIVDVLVHSFALSLSSCQRICSHLSDWGIDQLFCTKDKSIWVRGKKEKEMVSYMGGHVKLRPALGHSIGAVNLNE